MTSLIRQFLASDDGATAIEYGLMAGLIAVAAITAFVIFGNSLQGLFAHVDTRTSSVMNVNF